MSKTLKKMKASELAFYQGVNCALAIVRANGQETVWQEIAAGCGGYALLRQVSAAEDNLEIDGFNEYSDPQVWRDAMLNAREVQS